MKKSFLLIFDVTAIAGLLTLGILTAMNLIVFTKLIDLLGRN